MAHELHFDEARVIVDDVVEIARPDLGARIRVHRARDGAAVVIVASDATCDGAPLLGNVAVVAAGAGAIVRCGKLRVKIAWNATAVRRLVCAADAAPGALAVDSRRCRVCFGPFVPDETVVVCACDEGFHEDCDRARLDCPGCGAPRSEAP